MAGKTLAAVRRWRSTFGQHYGYSTSARGLYGYLADGGAYFPGEGDLLPGQSAHLKRRIPHTRDDPRGLWVSVDERPAVSVFAQELKRGMVADPKLREFYRLRVRSYFDRLPEGTIHPSQIGDTVAAIDRFLWDCPTNAHLPESDEDGTAQHLDAH